MAFIEWENQDGTKEAALQEVKEIMEEGVKQAKRILRGTGITQERAKGYWLASIQMAFSNEHEYLGKEMFTLQSAIEELAELENEDDDNDNDN